ncbi:MAG: collagen-like protein [Wolbachia sp.]
MLTNFIFVGNSKIPGAPGLDGRPGDKGEQGISGLPGQKGERGQVGDQGFPGERGEKGTDGKDANPSTVAERILSEKIYELTKAIIETPVSLLQNKTLGEYFRDDIAQDEGLRDIVVEALRDDNEFKKDIKDEKGDEGADGATPNVDEIVAKFFSDERHLSSLAEIIIEKEQQNRSKFLREIADYFSELVRRDDSLKTLIEGKPGPIALPLS